MLSSPVQHGAVSTRLQLAPPTQTGLRQIAPMRAARTKHYHSLKMLGSQETEDKYQKHNPSNQGRRWKPNASTGMRRSAVSAFFHDFAICSVFSPCVRSLLFSLCLSVLRPCSSSVALASSFTPVPCLLALLSPSFLSFFHPNLVRTRGGGC